MFHFHIITLFPESIEGYFKASMLKRAQEDKKIAIHFYNPRDYTKDKHKRVDQKPYGGGPGMVIEAPSVLRAAQAAIGRKKNVTTFFFTPSGEQFDMAMAKKYAKKKKTERTKHYVFICGHYEGVDERVAILLKAKKVSVGPFVLTGGELPAALMVDAITRYVPGVLGCSESLEDSRIASPQTYTRPEVLTWKGKKSRAPKVLLSGNHKEIDAWRKSKQKEK